MAVDSKFLQQISCTRKPILFVWLYFYCNSLLRGCSSVVERSLCMWKARGSIPRISTPFARYSELKLNEAVVAEWLRRWTWNPMGSARVGSNPANCDNLLMTCMNIWLKQKMPPMGIEPMTPGLRDQCSTTELKRLLKAVPSDYKQTSYWIEGQRGRVV